MKRSAYETTELEAARTSSVAKYFNPVVGQHDEIKTSKRDKYDNAKGAEYDLGKDGAFSDFKVLIGNFLACSLADPEAALKKKGFQVEIVSSEADFIKGLDTADVAMFLSGTIPGSWHSAWKTATRKKFVEAVIKFHESGKGVWCWTDNDPLFEHANAVLEHFRLIMKDNTPGNKILTLSDGTHDPPLGQFKRHVITTGIKKLYEGVTISYLDALPKHKQVSEEYPLSPFKVLAQSTDGHPVSAFLDNEFTGQTAGRMLVDGGFTKLYVNWDDAGTARYVVNGTIWLLGLERTAAQKANKKGGGGHWVWEWKNGDEWSPYHVEDASLLEKKKQQGGTTFSTKDLSFNKAHGTTYKFDLDKMTQTNSSTLTVVKMRRRAAKAKERHLAVGKAEEGEEDEKVLEEEEEETPKKKTKKTPSKKVEEEEEEETPKKKAKKTPTKKEEAEEEEEEEEEAPKKKKAKKGKWVWEWQKDKKKWLPYSLEDSLLLEAKLNDAQLQFKSSKLSFNKGQAYQLDLEEDTQTNLHTGTITKLRRRPATDTDEVVV